MKRRIPIVVAVLLAAGLGTYFALASNGDSQAEMFGYVEAETMLVGAKAGGRLAEVAVLRGATVQAGAPLFSLDDATETARLAKARAELAGARADLADLKTAQQRPVEIEILEAGLRRAKASLAFSEAEHRRQGDLFRRKIVAEAAMEQASMAMERDQAQVEEIERQIAAAIEPAREGRIAAATARLEAAEAALAEAEAALDDRRVAARAGGRVTEVFFDPGETVQPGQPVVEILPDDKVLVRFYVAEPRLATIAEGDRVEVRCDGCPDALTARIEYIARDAEFTPPMIFTRQERAKLVFLVKARPEPFSPHLRPGLPVQVRRAALAP
jgi:HlyD family secretion protein